MKKKKSDDIFRNNNDIAVILCRDNDIIHVSIIGFMQ